MKGLLLKDFMLLKNQKQFFIVIILVGGWFLLLNDNLDFVISYVSIMFSMFTVSTVSYDKYENGMSYLFTLPVSRKSYVREKYIFGALISLFALLAVSAAAWAVASLRHMDYPVEEWAVALAATVIIIAFFLGLSIPMQLKFEANKGQIAMLLAAGIAALVAYAAVRICKSFGVSIDAIFEKIEGAGAARLFFAGAVAVIVITGVSYLASVRIMEKKEL